MVSSKRVIALQPKLAAPGLTPHNLLYPLLIAASALIMMCTSLPASAQQSNGGIFGSMFGNSSGSRPHANRYRYNNYTSYNDSWLGSWSNSYSPVPQVSSRYRTLCVRTCDGFYFPISFSTTQAGLARDAQQCQARCGAPAKLFYHRNPGADVEHMIDLSGQPYSGLENAFRYRTEVVDSCRCTPQPWSEAARQEYDRRAELAKNPELAQAPDANGAAEPLPDARTEVAGWRSNNDLSRGPDQRQRRRMRYRANDPALEGHWWASSW